MSPARCTKIFNRVGGNSNIPEIFFLSAKCKIDGAFVAGKGGREDVQHGYKGKGLTLHCLVDGNGMPFGLKSTGAAESEREQVEILLDDVNIKTGKVGRPKKRPGALQGDKGYDSRSLRNTIRKRRITPMIPRRSWPNRKAPKGRPPGKPIDRWKVERTFGMAAEKISSFGRALGTKKSLLVWFYPPCFMFDMDR